MPGSPDHWRTVMRVLSLFLVGVVLVAVTKQLRKEKEAIEPVSAASHHAPVSDLPSADARAESDPASGEPFSGSVFERPQTQVGYQRLQIGIAQAFQLKKFELARQMAEKALELSPNDPSDHYNLACAEAQLGQLDEALENLDASVRLGFHDADHILADDDLAPLRGESRFTEIADRARSLSSEEHEGSIWEQQVTPFVIKDGIAWVTEDNTVWDYRKGVFRTFFEFPDRPVEEKVATGFSGPRRWLRSWYKKGTAAGNHGDLYDNHDGDHSNLGYQQFPQLTRVEYGKAARALNLSMGLQLRFFHNQVTIGNSSTAQVQSVFWRSQPRAAYVTQSGAALLHAQYASNHLYFYVEHRDYDPGHNGEGKGEGGYGDVYPANTPYVIISQGSSGSDQPFMEAIAAALAAFRPEVKERLKEEGALMPAIQMLFRMSNDNVPDRETYLSGIAHPPVFDAEELDVARLVKLTQSIQADALPPRVRLRVTEEDQVSLYGGERLFDTPQAIARVFRSPKLSRRMVISAEGSEDPQGEPLTYHWKVLCGDSDKIEIRPLNADGSIVELVISYHQRRPIRPGSELETNRVDIGAFVSNAHHVSAPAFISTYFLDCETRVYDEAGRLLSIDFADPATMDNYVDPLIDPVKDWRDEFDYRETTGELMGWTRHREGSEPEEFTGDGKRVAARNPDGSVMGVKEVGYAIQPDKEGLTRPRMVTIFSDQVLPYPPAGSKAIEQEK